MPHLMTVDPKRKPTLMIAPATQKGPARGSGELGSLDHRQLERCAVMWSAYRQLLSVCHAYGRWWVSRCDRFGGKEPGRSVEGSPQRDCAHLRFGSPRLAGSTQADQVSQGDRGSGRVADADAKASHRGQRPDAGPGRDPVLPGDGWWVPMSRRRLMVIRRIGECPGLSQVIWAVAGSE